MFEAQNQKLPPNNTWKGSFCLFSIPSLFKHLESEAKEGKEEMQETILKVMEDDEGGKMWR